MTLAAAYPNLKKEFPILSFDAAQGDTCFALDMTPTDLEDGWKLLKAFSILTTENMERWATGDKFAVVRKTP